MGGMVRARHAVVLGAALRLLLASPGMAAASPERTIAIERPQQLSGHPVGGQLPIVTLRIGAVSLRFLFDTGASEVVLSEQTAAQLGLRGTAMQTGADSGGVAVAGHYVTGVDLATADGAPLRHFDRVLAMPLGPLEALGLAGVIGPQALAATGCVRVDFRGGVATVAGADAAACRPLTKGANVAAPGWRGDDRPHVPVGVGDGANTSPFLVDSGAWRSAIPPAAATQLPRLRTAQSRGVGGKMVTMDIVGPVTLKVGNAPRPLPEAAVVEGRPTGVLGFDLLSGMTLVLHADGAFSIGE
ncbi:Aspartyl protease [compost metagenome]